MKAARLWRDIVAGENRMGASSSRRLVGRRVLITGAGSGIGRQIAILCAREGAKVALVGRTRETLEATAAMIGSAHVEAADVTDEARVERAVAASVAALGGLDGIVNCAGFATIGPIEQTSLADWHALLDIHMTATFLVCRASIAALRGERSAAIVNVASVAGLMPGISSAAYAAAKGGQILFSKALAAELAPEVRVNALVVGPTETPLTAPNFQAMHDSGTYEDFIGLFPLRRVAKPEEIANVAAMLLSDEASFVTGAAWTVDGGRSLH
jgi:NAD(P)-dependent dehydrogenase (short-subunit alcohol dehydrogenase family)